MTRKKIARYLTGAAIILTIMACVPAAAPSSENDSDATSDPTQVSTDNASGEAPVIQVDKEVESEGITIGVTHVELTSEQTLVSYWRDCGDHEPLEPVGEHYLITEGGLELQETGGGPGSVCDPSEIRQMRFGPVPAGTETVTLQHGPIIGAVSEDLILELPIGSYLSELERFGGTIDLSMTVQSGDLAYKFTELGYGLDRFSLDYEPANEAARWRPMGGSRAEITLEDDLGNQLPGGTGGSRFDGDLALKSGILEFSRAIDPAASVWTIRIQNPGKVYRGPWEIEIPVPSDTPLASASPTAVPEPSPTAAPAAVIPPRPTPVPGVEPSRLEETLAMTPLEFSQGLTLFSDYDGSRVVTDLEELRGPEIPDQIESGKIHRLYEGVLLPDDLRNYSSNLHKQIGLNIMGMDSAIWSMKGPWDEKDFLMMRGVFDQQDVASKLTSIDYKEAEYQGNPYYWLFEEIRADIRHPLRHLSLQLNRIALTEDRFMAAASTIAIEKLVDSQEAEGSSLLDSRPHRAIAESVGHGLLSAALVTPEWIVENWNTRNKGPVERLERYEEGPDSWGQLSPYTLALLGYRVRGESEDIVMAFFYPDASSAGHNAAEMEKRWNSFYYDQIGSREEEVPATDFCAPFTSEVVARPDYSILIGTCEVIRSVEQNHVLKGPHFWTWLFNTRELHFLAPDLAALKAAHQDEEQ